MIYGKLWCVVKPSVGIPIFLGAVAVGSFAVHLALVTNTTWIKDFLNGGSAAASAAITAPVISPSEKV
jgi:light-harvesting protein B-800-850 alpha chain